MISGVGFSLDTGVTVCDKECTVTSVTPDKSSLECTMTALDVFKKTTCLVNVTNIDESTGDGISRLTQVIADPVQTPVLFDVSPSRGGTEGGTRVTLSGFNFGTDINDVSVTIHGVECVLKSVQDDEIICETERYTGKYKLCTIHK